jgi:hypothetical protein
MGKTGKLALLLASLAFAVVPLLSQTSPTQFSNGPAFTAAKLAADSEFAAALRPRVVSTTIALTWVATGQRAAYITDGDMRNSVHFAAGLAICGAAGCTGNRLERPAMGLCSHWSGCSRRPHYSRSAFAAGEEVSVNLGKEKDLRIVQDQRKGTAYGQKVSDYRSA